MSSGAPQKSEPSGAPQQSERSSSSSEEAGPSSRPHTIDEHHIDAAQTETPSNFQHPHRKYEGIYAFIRLSEGKTNSYEYECRFCQQVYTASWSSSYNLKRHLDTMHYKDNPQQFAYWRQVLDDYRKRVLSSTPCPGAEAEGRASGGEMSVFKRPMPSKRYIYKTQ